MDKSFTRKLSTSSMDTTFAMSTIFDAHAFDVSQTISLIQ